MPTVGHLPLAIFDRPAPAVETRAITPGPSSEGRATADRSVCFRAIGCKFPRHRPCRRSRCRPGPDPENNHGVHQADTLAKDASAPSTAAAVTLENRRVPSESPASFEVRVEDLAVMPTLEAAL